MTAPATRYAWTDYSDPPWSVLLPSDESNPHSLRRIASIKRNSDGLYVAAYHWPHSTGNKTDSWVFLKTRRGAKRWVERQLAGFWEPPAIEESAA